MCCLKMGCGSKRYYRLLNSCFDDKNYCLQQEQKPNGNQIHYEYDKTGYLKRIETRSATGKVFAWAEFNRCSFVKNSNPSLEIVTSDGRKLSYQFINRDDKYRFFINYVTRPNQPPVAYTYDNKIKKNKEMINLKVYPDNRYLLTEYYETGKQAVANKWVIVEENKDPIQCRVKKQLAPVGNDSKPITTHSFIYDLKKNKTEVYNAYNHPTYYFYSKNSVLTCIQQFVIKNISGVSVPIPYCYENFYWGKPGSANQGNLICRTISQAAPYYLANNCLEINKDKTLACKSYRYDYKGNVICQSLWGNLTGVNPQPVILNEDGYPIENGCDHHDIRYKYSEDSLNLLIKEIHPNGKVILYHYLPGTDLMIAKFTLADRYIILREFYQYNEDAVLIQTIRDDGHTLDPMNLTGVTERHATIITPKLFLPCVGLPEVVEETCLNIATGQVILLKKMINIYDPLGNLIEQQHYDSLGELAYTLYWQYDEWGNLILEKDAQGQSIERRYDTNGNIIFEQGPNTDYYKTFTYDYANRLIRMEEIDSIGFRLTNTYRYDLLGNKIAAIDIHGNETQYVYDEFSRLIQEIHPTILSKEKSLVRPIINYTYDVLGNRIAIKDARGFITSRDCNLRGQPTTIYYPDGSEEYFEYTTDGKLAKSIDRKGLKTIYEYDILDRIAKTSQYANDQLLSVKVAVYSTFHLIQEVDELGRATIYSYDSAGRLASKQGFQQLTTYEYDSLGRQNCTQDWITPTEYLKRIQTYNVLNQVIEERIQDQTGEVYHRLNYEYSPDGQQTAVTTYGEKKVCTTKTICNLRKQPLVIIDGEGNKTITIYNNMYRNKEGQFVLQAITTDPIGHQIVTTYDALDQVICIEQKDTLGNILQKKEMFYDISSNKECIVETVFNLDKPIRQIVTLASYDCMNRLIHFVEASESPQAKHTFYTYNVQGQKESITKPDGCVIWHTYDLLGRLATFKSSDGCFNYNYEYNAKGLPTQVQDVKSGTSTYRVYDINDKMIQERLQNGLWIAYNYDGIGRPIRITLPDGTGILYEYKGSYLYRAIRLDAQDKALYHHTYQERDLSGNSLREELALKCGDWRHCYDCLGRPIESISDQWQETQISYNALGSLISRDFKDVKGIEHCFYQYDDLDQIKEELGSIHHEYVHDSAYNRIAKDEHSYLINDLNQLTQQGSTYYCYDVCGNCVQKIKEGKETIYRYDTLDRLIAVSQDGKEVTYQYDAFNRRISKTIDNQSIIYLYAEQNEIAALENGQIKEFRLLGTGKGAEIGAAVAIEIQQKIYIPLHDHNGNMSCLLDEQGNPVETYRYSVYGEEEVYDGLGQLLKASINPWRFSSKRHDTETGWIYFGRRYYDPETGRWMTPDPLGQEGGPNLYTYVLNNPLTHIDLYGLIDTFGFFSFLVGQLLSWLGNSVITIGYEGIPFPVIKDCVTGFGHIIRDGHLDNFVPSYREPHSQNNVAGVWDDTQVAEVYVNGIRTSKKEVENRYQNSSSICNGKKIYYAYNAMHGLVADLLEWIGQRLGVPTNSVDKLVTNIRERIEMLGGVNGGGRINLYAHSQGGEIVASLRRVLTKEELNMINVKTYGSANLFSQGDFCSVIHYVSTRDWVPLIASPVQYTKACFEHRPEVVFLPSLDPSSFMDHSFEGKTYQTQYKKDIYCIK